MKGLPLKLKGRLYSAFIHSVLLYNSEVWTITETEMKALVGRNGYLMRMVGEVVRNYDMDPLAFTSLSRCLNLTHLLLHHHDHVLCISATGWYGWYPKS